jgi:hypothetical protein
VRQRDVGYQTVTHADALARSFDFPAHLPASSAFSGVAVERQNRESH